MDWQIVSCDTCISARPGNRAFSQALTCSGDHRLSSPSCTRSRSSTSAASFAAFGRAARASACACAASARYAPRPPFRATSRLTVDAGRPSRPGDRPVRLPLRPAQRNLLPLAQRQVPSRPRLRRVRLHPARQLHQPPPRRRAHPSRHRRLPRPQTRPDPLPEPHPNLTRQPRTPVLDHNDLPHQETVATTN
jgi:hypothetical protein